MAEMMWREHSSLRESRVTVSSTESPHTVTRLSMVWSERLVAALAEPVSEHTAAVLVSVPVTPLDEEGLLLRVRLADRVLAWAQAQAHIALGDYVGSFAVDGDQERHLRLEVRIARGCSDDAAGTDIDSARRLAGPCRVVRDLLESGEISDRHVWPVLNRTQGIDDELAQAALELIGSRLPRMASTRVGGVLSRALAKIDPKVQAQRARAARSHDVGVSFRSLPDGLAQVTATHRVEDARAIMEIVDTAADRFLHHQGSCQPCADAVPHEIGPARAAAHLAMVLRAENGPDAVLPIEPARLVVASTVLDHDAPAGADDSATETTTSASTSATAAPLVVQGKAPKRRRSSRRGETQVVMDFTTWLGLDDNPGMVAGHPIPAEIAREISRSTGSLRRIVTDPADGHLIDHGDRIYLPDDLRRHVAARDAHCQAPGCGQPAERCELEHIIPFPHGASSTTNTDMYCKRDHISKTRGDLEILHHDKNGSATWRTRHGQAGHIEPRPYLNPPEPPTPRDPWIDDPPPF
jgi:hypothetical protein